MDGKYIIYPVTSIINPSYSDAMDYINMLEKADEPIAYDIEVISNETACVGLSNNDREGICISWRNRSEVSYPLDRELALRKRLQALLGNPSVKTVVQNGHFDASWLAYKDRIVPAPHYFDTMLAHHLLYPSLPHGLGYITTQYTTRPYYKDELNAWKEGGNIDEFWHYNVQDCCNTWAAHFAMLGELKAQGLEKFFFDHVMRLQPHLIKMTVGGVLVDMEYKEKVAVELKAKIINMLEEFHNE
jgi:DNA polymerase I-like protein with 3'-5' exonuclease and polymerase domains